MCKIKTICELFNSFLFMKETLKDVILLKYFIIEHFFFADFFIKVYFYKCAHFRG